MLPLRGQVPSTSTITSLDDPTLRAAVLSTHDDGSAAVVVVAGEAAFAANATRSIALQVTPAVADTALTAARVAQLVSSVTVNFGSSYGSASLTTLSNPERIWWASSRVICSRYRLAAPTPGSTALEAVIDITAFPSPHDRALVEVVIENAKLSPGSPTKPAAASYTGLTVSVNGTQIVSTSSGGPASAEGNHAAFRAWYTKGWVGGDPGLRATQVHTALQAHPLLWRMDQSSTFDMATYAADTYVPWSTGRQRATGMGAAGDHPSIGPLPQWEAHALQSGDYRAWNATEVSALACLSYNINYRDSATGLVPTFAAVGTRAIASGTWPAQTNASDAAMWETAHAPDVGLMAFLSRPSPVFIELAQKAALWNGTWSSDNTPGWTAGLHGYWYQRRGRAWGFRTQGRAAFVTPSALAWKASARTALARNVAYLDAWRTDAKSVLGVLWETTPTDVYDEESGVAGYQSSLFQHWYTVGEVARLASARVLTGTDQTALDTLANWLATSAVRWVNEQANGGWRYHPYKDTLGDSATTINSRPTWGQERNRSGNHSDAPPTVAGSWMSNGGVPLLYSSYSTNPSAGAYYPSYFWAALVAAVDRGVAGSATAWSTVTNGITDLATWRRGFATDPRWGSVPKGS